jgi:hypothetical protein
MRRQLNRPPRKRQAPPLRGRKAVQRHAAWQARKADVWPPWVKREAISAAVAKDRSVGHRGEPLS